MILQAYELRWRIANPGFLPMKAAQRFMRPVKEIREGFFTMDDDSRLLGSTADSSNALGPHAISATRHFEEQYSNRAAEAGLLSSATLSSRMSTPRGSAAALAFRSGSTSKHSLSSSTNTPRHMTDTAEKFGCEASQQDAEVSAGMRGAASLLQHQPV